MRELKNFKIREKDFVKLSTIDKFRYCIAEPDRYEKLLTDQEQKQFDKLYKVYHLTYKEISTSKSIKIVRQEITGADDWKTASRLVKDALDIFSDYININKKARRLALAERLFDYIEYLEEKEKYFEAAVVAEKAAKIGGYDKDDIEQIDWSKIQIPGSIYDSDPKLLEQEYASNEEEVEDEE